MSSTIDQLIIEDFYEEYKIDMIESIDDATVENGMQNQKEHYEESVKYKLFDEPLG